MIRHPRSTTLFPYTTLFRSVEASQEIVAALPPGIGRLHIIAGAGHFAWLDAPEACWPAIGAFVDACSPNGRSEEHTSELQSHVNLVCRLLLEKKKKKMNRTH